MRTTVRSASLFIVGMFALAAAIPSRAATLPAEIPPDAVAVAGPMGWQRLCERRPGLCASEPAPAPLELDAATLSLLATVQREVDAAIRPLEEPPGVDEWRLAPAAGDCEDYALTKRARLIAAGVPAGNLYFAVVLTERDEFHTVLFVDTNDGIRVLDNRLDEVVSWQDLRDRGGYRLLMAELPGSGGQWRATDIGLALALRDVLLGAVNRMPAGPSTGSDR